MKVSIIMTIFNRRRQFLTTLRSIRLTQYPHDDFEVRVIDDGSDSDQKVGDLTGEFDFSIYLKEIRPSEKRWQEPIALINQEVRESEGEIVIYQNGECCHVGDVISYAVENTKKGRYIAFGCFNVTQELSAKIDSLDRIDRQAVLDIVGDPPKIMGRAWMRGGTWWYNHSIHRPVGYYFCASFMKEDYLALGGIDERFQYGIHYADNEFLDRIRKKMELVFVDDPFVIHQYHEPFLRSRDNYRRLKFRNNRLYERIRAEAI